MDNKFRTYAANADFNPVDRLLAVEALKKELLPIIEPLVDFISKINIDINADNQLLINGVAISDDFRYCSDFTSSVFPEYLFFNDNGNGTFVNLGIKNLEEEDKVFEVFRISRRDKRIKEIKYRSPERKGTPLISPLAKADEFDEVMKIIEREGIKE